MATEEKKNYYQKDIFDTPLGGTRIRMSVVCYIFAAIALVGYFLPYFYDTLQTRNKYTENGYVASEKTDLGWNDASSSGLQVALGKTLYFEQDVKECDVRIALTPGYLHGMYSREEAVYLSYGSILAALVPILIIYIAILIASRAQWQNGGGFLASGVASALALLFQFIVLFQLAGLFATGSEKRPLDLVFSRFGEIFTKLGVGFYITLFALIASIVACFYAWVRLRNDKCYIVGEKK